MTDESHSISAKSWSRAADSINKVGFMDGAADGQKATFQSSFDTGYQLGFNYGFELGINAASLRYQNKQQPDTAQDPRRINCQICLNNISAQEDIVNLYNFQKEKNDQHLLQNSKLNTT
ncbi:hypothetical protein NE865_04774 [Phthorimaea operculella]|nr:hypothetical protein NE865_04774 [Phthorimaea operculella]